MHFFLTAAIIPGRCVWLARHWHMERISSPCPSVGLQVHQFLKEECPELTLQVSCAVAPAVCGRKHCGRMKPPCSWRTRAGEPGPPALALPVNGFCPPPTHSRPMSPPQATKWHLVAHRRRVERHRKQGAPLQQMLKWMGR